jgi:undecaprenyl diphosphate synthase
MPLDQQTTPQHLAIIMDGNRRWAQQRKLPAAAGHLAGVYAIRTKGRLKLLFTRLLCITFNHISNQLLLGRALGQ